VRKVVQLKIEMNTKNRSFPAAHCLQQKHQSVPLQSQSFYLLFGRHNLSDSSEKHFVKQQVNKFAIHPDWKFDEEKYDADLAIIFMQGRIEFTNFIQPVCLPAISSKVYSDIGYIAGEAQESSDESFAIEKLISGWGQSESSGNSHEVVPKQVEIKKVKNEFCFLKYYQLGRLSSARTFCAGNPEEEKSACKG